MYPNGTEDAPTEPRRALWAAALALSALASTPNARAGGISNGAFASGFDNWLGEITDVSFTTVSGISPLPGGYANSFTLDSGQAVLNTSTLSDQIFAVYLYQPFTVDTATPGETLSLSVDLVPVLSGPKAGDAFLATLVYGSGPLDFIDLASGSASDITFLSGRSVEIDFGVEDFDNLVDTLTVDNVAITHGAAVPAPATGALMLAGALALRRRPRAID